MGNFKNAMSSAFKLGGDRLYTFLKSFGNKVDNWFTGFTGSGLTPAEKEANEFNALEAQKQRDWEEQMSNTSFQRQVVDMRAAGVNPAMAMKSDGAVTPSGSSASSVSPSGMPSFSDLMQLFLLPLQKRLLGAQAQQAHDTGQAALINAKANAAGIPIKEGELGVRRGELDVKWYEAETHRMLKDIEDRKTEIYESMTDEQKKEVAERCALIKLQREQLPKQLAIAEQNADSESKRAIAALRSADAAVQNAATNDRLADYETSLKYTQELLTWYQAEGQKVIAQNLPERTRIELENLVKEGVYLDKRGNLVDRQGHLVTAQTVKTYVNVGTDISGAINQWVNPFSKGAANSSAPGFDLSGAYQGVAYGYD